MLITTAAECNSAIEQIKDTLFFDTETTGLRWPQDRAFMLQFGSETSEPFVIDADLSPDVSRLFLEWLYTWRGSIVGHNLNFDMKHLHSMGVPAEGKVLIDTEVLLRDLDENRAARGKNYKLKDVCADLIGESTDEQEVLNAELMRILNAKGIPCNSKKKLDECLAAGLVTYRDLPLDVILPYAEKDILLTRKLYAWCREEEKRQATLVAPSDHFLTLHDVICRDTDITTIALGMEVRGMQTDRAFLEQFNNDNLAKLHDLQQEIERQSGFTDLQLTATADVQKVMLKLGWKPTKFGKDGKTPKTDKYALDDWDHPAGKLLRSWRGTNMLVNNFYKNLISSLDDWGATHCQFNVNRARSGRFSCSNPNLQNVDKKSDARKVFICRKGYINFYIDLKQIELCGFAYYAGDAQMQEALWDGADFHRMNAAVLFDKPEDEITQEERTKAKTFSFALLYGAGIERIKIIFGCSDLQAKTFRDRYYARFPAIRKLTWRVKDRLTEQGFIINRFGRRRRMRPDEAYKGMNALIQGWAADLLKEAMRNMAEVLEGRDANLLVQVHDELGLEIRDDEHLMETLHAAIGAMTAAQSWAPTVPIRVDVEGTKTNWKDACELIIEPDRLLVKETGEVFYERKCSVPEIQGSGKRDSA